MKEKPCDMYIWLNKSHTLKGKFVIVNSFFKSLKLYFINHKFHLNYFEKHIGCGTEALFIHICVLL